MKRGLAIYAGGNHIFYILGALKYLFERGLKFEAIGTYSAGAAILPFLVEGQMEDAPEIFGRYLDANAKNIYLENLIGPKEVFPHDKIYADTINQILDYETIARYDKPLRVIVSEFRSRTIGNSVVGILALITLALNRRAPQNKPSIYLRAFRRLFGVTGRVVDIRACKTKEEMFKVIIGSSTIYPFIKIRTSNGLSMLDGKLSLMTPVGILDDCESVLSIHAHPTFLPERAGLYSIFPKEKVVAGPLNYVGSAEIKSSFEQGYREGQYHYEKLSKSPFFKSDK